MEIGSRVRTPSGFTGVIVAALEWALVSRDDLPGWPPVPYDFFELEPLGAGAQYQAHGGPLYS